MSLNTVGLTDALKNNQYEKLIDLLNDVREVMKSEKLTSYNEHLLLDKFELETKDQLYSLLYSSLINTDIEINEFISKSKENTLVNKLKESLNVKEILTEEKFDYLIPNIKIFGIITSIMVVLLIFDFFGNLWILRLFYALGVLMATFGLCILLEGISTIIKLLRKISEK